MNNKIILKKSTKTSFSLEEIIKNSGITKKKLASKMGITPQWLYKLLSNEGELTINQLSSILRALGYELEIQLVDNQ